MIEDDIAQALQRAIQQHGSQRALAEASGVPQPSISKYLTGRNALSSITASTLEKLFPGMRIDFFGDLSKSTINSISVGGRVKAPITQVYGKGSVTVPTRTAEVLPSPPPDRDAASVLQKKILKSDKLTSDQKITLLEFLTGEDE